MSDSPRLRFGAIGLDHRHIYDQVQSLLDVGASCVGVMTRSVLQYLRVKQSQETVKIFVLNFRH